MDIVMKRDAQGRERPQEKDFNDRRVVRVVPTNERLRKYLKHPSRGGFLAEGASEWPLDQFTKRRIKEGDITIEEREAEAEAVEGQAEGKAQGEQKTIESSGAKSPAASQSPNRRTPSETSATVDPDKTTAPKT